MLAQLGRLGATGVWMLVGRGSGILFRILVIGALGLGNYGLYATATAFAAIISAPLENVFVVRSVRVSHTEYERERTTRLLIGLTLIVAGVLLFLPLLVLGFALIVAGAEMVFNAYKSLPLREGRANAPLRLDATRQVASIVLTAAYLFVVGHEATLSTALAIYVAPYIVVVVLTVVRCWGIRPAVPGGLRENLLLLADAFVISLYLQGDIVLLGILASNEAVGAYSLGSQIALALSTFGQVYAQTFNVRLRESGGHPSSGPSIKVVGGLAVFFTLGTVVVGLVLVLIGWQSEIGTVLLVIGLFAGLRTIDNAWTTVLYIQRRDAPRILHAALALAIKFAAIPLLILALVPGAIAAALAAVIAELYLCVMYTRLTHRPLENELPVDPDEPDRAIDAASPAPVTNPLAEPLPSTRNESA